MTEVDLQTVENVDFEVQSSFVITRDGNLNGLGGWFIAQLASGVRVSNVPPLKTPSWNQVYFPIRERVHFRVGDLLNLVDRIFLERCWLGMEDHYQWIRARTIINRSGGNTWTSKLQRNSAIEEHFPIQIINIDQIESGINLGDLLINTAFIGNTMIFLGFINQYLW
jgi:hypothetical protein